MTNKEIIERIKELSARIITLSKAIESLIQITKGDQQ